MRQLHIRAQSGPRPVTAAAVRAMLADGSIDPTSPVLSLDAGCTWQPVSTALTVIDGFAVDDTAVDRALRVGPLHPIAMPLGAMALVLLTAGIGLGGGPAAQVIIETPIAATAAVAATTAAGVSAIQAGVVSGCTCIGSVAAAFMNSGMTQVTMPDVPDAATAKPISAAPSSGDLATDWRQLLANREFDEAAWSAAAEALGKRTEKDGLIAWSVSLTMLETVTDENRKRYTEGVPGAGKTLRVAMLEFDTGPGIERVNMQLLVEDKALATSCDSLAAAGRDLRISAKITKVLPDPAKRGVLLQGLLSSAE